MKKPSAPVATSTLSQRLRLYLYLTAAVTGAAIMIVEILGAKMLSPYFGLSHFVWTAQIAITLVALSCGYYAGGRLVDHTQNVTWLYRAIYSAAIYLILTVRTCEPVAYACLNMNLAAGSLLASGILFFLPLALLAMTGPFLVRVITSSLAGVGGNVGRLTSVGTVGSLLGTLLIGYILIPHLPNSFTMYFTGLALLLVCAGYFAMSRNLVRATIILMAIACAALYGKLLGIPAAEYKHVIERFSGNSNFGKLQVVDRKDGSCRFYLNDNLIQNTYDVERKQSVSHFTYMLAGLARCYTTNITDVLCLGLGVGIVPMDFAHSGAKVDVVEINPAVVPVGVKYFDLETNLINLTLDDARHYLNRCHKQYDVVVLDAFLGDSSPSHLMTREAFTSIRRVLRPGGTLVINMFGDLGYGRDFFTASLKKTLLSVFPGVRLHSATGDGGIFFAATDRVEPEFVHQPDFDHVHPEVLVETRQAFAGLVDTNPEDGRILTDDYNPVEFYDAQNREEIRRRLAFGAKDM